MQLQQLNLVLTWTGQQCTDQAMTSLCRIHICGEGEEQDVDSFAGSKPTVMLTAAMQPCMTDISCRGEITEIHASLSGTN